MYPESLKSLRRVEFYHENSYKYKDNNPCEYYYYI